jgi:hypothetical protein
MSKKGKRVRLNSMMKGGKVKGMDFSQTEILKPTNSSTYEGKNYPYIDKPNPRYLFKLGKPQRVVGLEEFRWAYFQPTSTDSATITPNGSVLIQINMEEKVAILMMADSVLTFDIRLTRPANGVNVNNDARKTAYWPTAGWGGMFKKVDFRINDYPIKTGDDNNHAMLAIRKLTTMGQSELTSESAYGFSYWSEQRSNQAAQTPEYNGGSFQANPSVYSVANQLKDVDALNSEVPPFYTYRAAVPLRDLVEAFQYNANPSYGATCQLKLYTNFLAQAFTGTSDDPDNVNNGIDITSAILTNIRWQIPAIKLESIGKYAFDLQLDQLILKQKRLVAEMKLWQLFSFDIPMNSLTFQNTVSMPGFRPTSMILAFQRVDFLNDITADKTFFTSAGLATYNVDLNGRRVKDQNVECSFVAPNINTWQAYNDFLEFGDKDLKNDVLVSQGDYTKERAFFVIDLTQVSRSYVDPTQTNNTAVVRGTFSNNLPVAHKLWVVVVYDKALEIGLTKTQTTFRDHPIQP